MGVGRARCHRSRREPRADRPDRLVGDDQIGGGRPVGHRAGELAVENGERLAGLALCLGFADAEDGEQPGAPGGLGLGADQGVGLAVVGPPLGVADDDELAAGIGDHLGGNVAGMGARGCRMAVLRRR